MEASTVWYKSKMEKEVAIAKLGRKLMSVTSATSASAATTCDIQSAKKGHKVTEPFLYKCNECNIVFANFGEEEIDSHRQTHYGRNRNWNMGSLA